ncbi:MAG: hypothetical protein FWC26_09375 [Fibromonadales bacterium]|nr:hypothetical protein [Fibromonadales bacterium]
MILRLSLFCALLLILSCSQDERDNLSDPNGNSSSGKSQPEYCIIGNDCYKYTDFSEECESWGGTPSDICPEKKPSSSSAMLAKSSSSVGENADALQITETYSLRNIISNFFEYFETDERYICEEGGVLYRWIDNEPDEVTYSISNNVLVYQDYWWSDTIHFSGTSNDLFGTWTRIKNNKDKVCESIDENRTECKGGWQIVKAEITADTLKLTSELCMTDEINSKESNGWKIEAINCNAYEASKGTEKIYVYASLTGTGRLAFNYTYNGKTCHWNQDRTVPQFQAACTKAWNKVQTDGGYIMNYYHNFLNSTELNECMKKNEFPADFLEED